MDRLALILVIIGAIVWGFVGIFAWNPVAWIFGGSMTALSRIVYVLVGLGGLWSIRLLFRQRVIEPAKQRD